MHYLYHIRHPEQWVTRAGAFSIVLTTTLPVVTVAYMIMPSDMEWWIKLLVLTGWVLLVLVAWFCFQQWYFRSGSGRRVALGFDAFRTPIEEIQRTRSRIKQALSDKDLRKNISIRMVPVSVLKSNPEDWLSRYGFDMGGTVTVSPDPKDSQKNVYQVSLTNRVTESEEVFKQRVSHLGSVLRRPFQVSSAADIADAHADRLFDGILLMMAYHDLSLKSFPSASRLAKALEVRLQDSVAKDRSPRKEVRIIDAMALTGYSQYGAKNLPNDPAEIEKASKYASLAVKRYGSEFPICNHLEARNQFFLGNLDAAVDLVSSVDFKILNEIGAAYFYLDIAVLNLFRGNWQNSAEAFRNFFALDKDAAFNWDDLCEFARYARDMDYQGAEYILCIYSVIHNKSCDQETEEVLLKWLWDDRSREPLRDIYKAVKKKYS